VIFLSEVDVVAVGGWDWDGGGVVCANSPTVPMPTMAANVPEQIRFLMLPPINIRLATIRPSRADQLCSRSALFNMDPWLHASFSATFDDGEWSITLSFGNGYSGRLFTGAVETSNFEAIARRYVNASTTRQ
jgi:hypothetical protein